MYPIIIPHWDARLNLIWVQLKNNGHDKEMKIEVGQIVNMKIMNRMKAHSCKPETQQHWQ